MKVSHSRNGVMVTVLSDDEVESSDMDSDDFQLEKVKLVRVNRWEDWSLFSHMFFSSLGLY